MHAPVVHSLVNTDADSLAHLAALLRGERIDPMVGRSLVDGSATGPLVGGNLAMIAASCGTPYALDARGCILVLEDIGEHPYRLERALAQLRDCGGLDGVIGVALGTFSDCGPPESATWSLDDIWREWFADRGVPVAMDLPIGHGAANRAFVVRRPATLTDGVLDLDVEATAARST